MRERKKILKDIGLEVRIKGNDHPSCGVEDTDEDGFDDLVCRFQDDSSAWSIGNGEATLAGTLVDGTLVTGTDWICVVP